MSKHHIVGSHMLWLIYGLISEDKMRLLTSTADPYELTLSTGPSRYQSTQQSRNTPASGTSSPVVGGQVQVAVNG